MARRIVDGEGLWRSVKLGQVQPLEFRAEYANLLPLALANGVFEINKRGIWADVFSFNRPDITPEIVEAILAEFERVRLLFRWKTDDGKEWGYWTGIDKPGRLPPASRLANGHDRLGPCPPKEQVEHFLSSPTATGQPVANPEVATGSLGLGVGLGSGVGVGSGLGENQEQHTCSDSAKSAEPERESNRVTEPDQAPEVKTETSPPSNGGDVMALVPPESQQGNPKPERPAPDDVEAIYWLYPKHVGKQAALKKIMTAIHRVRESRKYAIGEAITFLKERTIKFAQSPAGQQGQYTPHPATWFYRGSYDDDEREWFSDARKENAGDHRLQQDLAAIRCD